MKTFALVLLLAAAAAGYLGSAWTAAPTELPTTLGATAERTARGRRVYALAGCDRCHSERDFTRFAGPVAAGRRGAGTAAPPFAPNITSHRDAGIGAWSDGEIVRAVRDGVGRDGRVLAPEMPSAVYRALSDEDAACLVAYLRSLDPVPGAPPRAERRSAGGWLARFAVRPAGGVPAVAPSDRLRYGAYLASVGGCGGCHTRDGAAAFSGGREFRLGRARVVSANLTPHPYAGIGRWSERDFIERFHQYRSYLGKGAPEVGPEGVTVMPWLELCRLEEGELGAIFEYLQSLSPASRGKDLR